MCFLTCLCNLVVLFFIQLKLDNSFFFFLRKIIHQKCLDIDDQSLSSARRLVKRMSD